MLFGSHKKAGNTMAIIKQMVIIQIHQTASEYAVTHPVTDNDHAFVVSAGYRIVDEHKHIVVSMTWSKPGDLSDTEDIMTLPADCADSPTPVSALLAASLCDAYYTLYGMMAEKDPETNSIRLKADPFVVERSVLDDIATHKEVSYDLPEQAWADAIAQFLVNKGLVKVRIGWNGHRYYARVRDAAGRDVGQL
jgi:hypothetical protein